MKQHVIENPRKFVGINELLPKHEVGDFLKYMNGQRAVFDSHSSFNSVSQKYQSLRISEFGHKKPVSPSVPAVTE